MEQTKPPPRCGYVGSMTYGRMTGGDPVPVAKPAPCWSDATHIVNGEHHRCPDHLVALLDGSPGATWEVARLDAPLGVSPDDQLEQAGIPRTMSGLLEHHATLAERLALLISQRDRLDGAIAWLSDDPRRLIVVRDEIERRRAEALEKGKRRVTLYAGTVISPEPAEVYADMHTPTVGQTIARLMEPISIRRTEERAKHEAAMAEVRAIEDELSGLEKRHPDIHFRTPESTLLKEDVER